MSGDVKELKAKDFDDFVSKGNCVVDFWAEWCGPCKMLKPQFEEAAKALKGKVNFAKVDIEGEGVSELTEKFMVMSVPTLMFFKKGEEIDRVVGAQSKEDIVKICNKIF